VAGVAAALAVLADVREFCELRSRSRSGRAPIAEEKIAAASRATVQDTTKRLRPLLGTVRRGDFDRDVFIE
jgi:hypothetical protein